MSGWQSISSALLQPTFAVTAASLADAHRGPVLTERYFVEKVFGAWVEEKILPYLNQNMTAKYDKTVKKIYTKVDLEVFLNYFFAECLRQLAEHKKHRIPAETLATAGARLIGKNRRKAISGRMVLGDHTLEDIIASWTPHVLKFLTPGSTYCVDETIAAHFGKIAADKGKLRSAPGKPYDYGMWIYVLAQQLHWSGLPIMLGMHGTFLRHTMTQGDAAIALLMAIRHNLEEPNLQQLVIADSHWCAGAIVQEFQLRGIRFCISTKSDNGIVPNELLTLAKSDLPMGMVRTYSKGPLIMQMTGSRDDATGLISDGWCLPGVEDQSTRFCSYETAVCLYKNETPVSLIRWFKLEAEWEGRSLAEIIYEITGWDPLRPEDQQGSNAALTYAQASKMSKKALMAVYDKSVPTPRKGRGKTKKEMLATLFPPEAIEHEEAIEAEQEVQRKKRTRDKVQAVEALREQVHLFYVSIIHFLIAELPNRFVAIRRKRRHCTSFTRNTAAWSIARMRSTTTSFTSVTLKTRTIGGSTPCAFMLCLRLVHCGRSTDVMLLTLHQDRGRAPLKRLTMLPFRTLYLIWLDLALLWLIGNECMLTPHTFAQCVHR